MAKLKRSFDESWLSLVLPGRILFSDQTTLGKLKSPNSRIF